MERPLPVGRPSMPARQGPTRDGPLLSEDHEGRAGRLGWEAAVLGELAVMNAGCDVLLKALESCSEQFALSAVEQVERLGSRVEAMKIRAQVRLAQLRPPPDGEPCSRYVDDEIAALLGQSPRTAADRLSKYWDIATRLPSALAMLAAGELDYARVRALAEATSPLTDEQTADVEQKMLAGRKLASPSAWRIKARKLVHRADPAAASRRRAEVRRNRNVTVRPSDDGMAQLTADLAAEDARAVMDRIDRIARADATADGDTRDIGAKRADVLTGLLLGNRREYVVTEIQVVIGAGTLLGLDDEPAELVGYGPIAADLARRLAGDAVWRRILTDPASGTVLDVGHRRFPTPALARYIRARTVSCTFPGCPTPAIRCDLDHTTGWARGGRTSHDNLGPACPHHHAMKDQPGWSLTQPQPGIFTWTSPGGRTYRTNGDDQNPPETPPGRRCGADDPCPF